MPVLLDGDALAARWRNDIRERAASSAFVRSGKRPCLATVLVGVDEASRSYVARKHGDCVELGFASRQIEMPADSTQESVLEQVEVLNRDPDCHGVLVQFPLPDHLDQTVFQSAVSPKKDVDGLHPENLGLTMLGAPGLRPCTPSAVIALLRGYGVALEGRRVAVIGRGTLVGRPLSIMLADPAVNAVPTLLHTAARDFESTLRDADVIVSAAGVPDLVQARMVRPGAAVVGVGITYVDGRMVSDIAAGVAGVAGFVTPSHGSVGPMTRALLMHNLLDAALAAG